ncbi:DUF1471 domain-containing protein [Salmonella enterica]|nr:DUF1471 domain-containing protein [Salmonella enterica]
MRFNTIAITVALLISPATFAAQITEHYAPETSIGHASVSSKSSLDDVINALSKKADKAGATHFKVVSAGGKNKYFGTAVLIRIR